jgi:hypothetical protein
MAVYPPSGCLVGSRSHCGCDNPLEIISTKTSSCQRARRHGSLFYRGEAPCCSIRGNAGMRAMAATEWGRSDHCGTAVPGLPPHAARNPGFRACSLGPYPSV